MSGLNVIQPEAEGDYREGIRWFILKHPNLGHYAAYIGIPIDSPKAGVEYDDVPVPVHGGWTWSQAGDGKYRPEGWYWWGWDYAHLGDHIPNSRFPNTDEHEWTLEEVAEEVLSTLPRFEKWLRSTAHKGK